MISTLTPNPSLDLTYELSAALARGAVQRATAVSVEAGGKGINVSRNLVANGIPSRAVAPVGGPSGEQFLSLLEGAKIELVRVPVAGAVRINTALAEKSGALTKINAGGPTLSEEDVERLLEETAAAARGATWLAACGSLPTGAPKDLLARAVAAAHQAGCKAAADGSGAPLAAALEAGPDLIKPNDEELAELVGRPLATFGDVLDAAEEARNRGAKSVLVSLGADGAILLDDNGVLHARTQPFVPRSTVGAGDALLAGFLAAGGEGEVALVEAIAWGAAAARLPGSRGPTPADLDRGAVQLQDAIDTSKRLKGEEIG
jgi:1-phosphofructokinase